MSSYFRNLKSLLGKLIFDKKRKQIQIVWTVVRLRAPLASEILRTSGVQPCKLLLSIFFAPAWTIIIRRCGFLRVYFFFSCSHKRLCLNDSGRVLVSSCSPRTGTRTNRLGAARKHKTHYARCKRALVKPHVHACSLTTVVKRSFFF